MENDEARAKKKREQTRLKVQRCRERKKLNTEGHIVKTPFNDRTNILGTADNANTPKVAGKLGQQGYHSGNMVSQQGKSMFTTPNDKDNCDEEFRRTHLRVGALEPHIADPDDESWLHRNDNFFPIEDQTKTPVECVTQLDNEQARAQKKREQTRLRVQRCREKKELNTEEHIVKTPFNDRTNIHGTAGCANTANVGGKLGQQGAHSGNMVSQQGIKRRKEQNTGRTSATEYSKQRKLLQQLDDNQKAAIRERNRLYVARYRTRAMNKQIGIDQDDLETSPNDTPMSAVDDPFIDSEEEFDPLEASTIQITDSIEDEVFYSARRCGAEGVGMKSGCSVYQVHCV